MKERQIFDIQLNAITDSDNPTKKECEFVLHGFTESHNFAFISKETAEKSLHTLKDMPIVAKYYQNSGIGTDDDALGSHELEFERDRETGDPIVSMGTIPIGVFTEDAYIKEIEFNGEMKEVVCGKGVLWESRFPNVIGLLRDWLDEGISVVSSMEILYDSYKVEEGITEILSYTYEGHCILNSSDRGDHKKVYPAYDESKLTKLVAEAINQENLEQQRQENEKECENVEKFKKVFELSHSDVRSKLYQDLDPKLESNQYSWIVDVYDNYFIAEIETYGEDSYEYKFYKVEYTKGEDDKVAVAFDSKQEVMEKREWVALEQLQTMQAELDAKVEELKTAQSSIETLKTEKSEVEGKFFEATETITQLNSTVDELKPFKEQADQEAYDKALSEKQELYKEKFEAVGASEDYETEEVQELIKQSLNATEGKEAEYKLSSMVFEKIKLNREEQTTEPVIRETASTRENLVPTQDDFDSRYSN